MGHLVSGKPNAEHQNRWVCRWFRHQPIVYHIPECQILGMADCKARGECDGLDCLASLLIPSRDGRMTLELVC